MTNKLTAEALSDLGKTAGAKLNQLAGERTAYILIAYCPVGGDNYTPMLTSPLPPETQLVALEEIVGALRRRLGKVN